MAIPMNFYAQDEWSGYPNVCFKRKFRWKFIIEDVSAYSICSLPPFKSGRPSLSYKEIAVEHLNETIYFPGKPEFKPISLTLYDIKKTTENPVFTWFKRVYDPTPSECSYYKPCLELLPQGLNPGSGIKCANAKLVLYDGCGVVMETWVFEHAWPQSCEFCEGDMSSDDIIFCDVTLRYDRAYIEGTAAPLAFPTIVNDLNCDAVPVPSSTDYSFLIVPPEFAQIR